MPKTTWMEPSAGRKRTDLNCDEVVGVAVVRGTGAVVTASATAMERPSIKVRGFVRCSEDFST